MQKARAPASTGKSLPREDRSFRLYLQQDLIRRCQQNPRYSLRAYARFLGIAPSPLSAILHGKRPITRKMRDKLGLALGLGWKELQGFRDVKTGNRKGDQAEFNYQQLSFDSFSVISDWYHYAILELTRVKDFRPDKKWIAKCLGLSQSEVRIAVERLQRLGLLKIEGKRWLDTSENGLATNFVEHQTVAATKKLQKQILDLGIQALSQVPLEARDHSSMTMAINPEDIPEAKKLIRKFRRDLCAILESHPEKKAVYHLGICLYPVSGNNPAR